MKINEIIKDNSILVIPNNIKKKVLLELNKLDKIYNIKIMSLNELIKSLTFSYDEKALHYLITKYDIKYEIALNYLNNIKYIENKNYKIEKLDKLVSIKKELDENDLLIYDNLFKELLKEKNIIIYGYDCIHNFELSILNKLENVQIIEKENYDYTCNIYEFNSIEQEVEFVATKICELLNNNIDLNKIKLCNVKDEYFNYIRRIFSMYNININLDDRQSIYSTKLCKDFIELLKENKKDISLKDISEKYDLKNENNLYIYNSIIKVLNKYYFVDDFSSVIDILEEEFKNKKLKINNYKMAIEIIDIKDNYIDNDEYVFLLGFNQTIIPKIYKNEDYLNDDEKELLGLEKSYEKNTLEKNNIKNIIKRINNLIITYKLKTPFDSYYPSMLIDELNFNVIKNNELDYHYSNKINKIHLSKQLDNFIKYGSKYKDINLLYSTYSNIKYMSFDNKFTGIKEGKLKEYIKNKLLLSYSSMDNYYKCSFKYYLNNILKLNDYEETFAIYIGKLFHYILSICFSDIFDFEHEFNNYIKDNEFSYKDKFYINKLKEDLKFIIKTIKDQNTHSSFNNSLYEEKIFINNDGNVKVSFMGIIDKMLYKEENNNTYVVIIDYKTGNPELNLNNSIYGLDLQLPVYLYLAKNCDKIKNVKIIGFYLQKILNNKFNITKKKTYKMLKKDSLKLQGYSINKEYLIEKIDDTYENSEVIKSMKLSKNGFYAYSKIINEEKINKLIDLTENKINEATKNILSANFSINPKKINKKNMSCEFCKYKDVCYMTENDIVSLKEYKNLEFLGGEEDA